MFEIDVGDVYSPHDDYNLLPEQKDELAESLLGLFLDEIEDPRPEVRLERDPKSNAHTWARTLEDLKTLVETLRHEVVQHGDDLGVWDDETLSGFMARPEDVPKVAEPSEMRARCLARRANRTRVAELRALVSEMKHEAGASAALQLFSATSIHAVLRKLPRKRRHELNSLMLALPRYYQRDRLPPAEVRLERGGFDGVVKSAMKRVLTRKSDAREAARVLADAAEALDVFRGEVVAMGFLVGAERMRPRPPTRLAADVLDALAKLVGFSPLQIVDGLTYYEPRGRTLSREWLRRVAADWVARDPGLAWLADSLAQRGPFERP